MNNSSISAVSTACVSCGYGNVPGELRCERCGRRLPVSSEFTAASAAHGRTLLSPGTNVDRPAGGPALGPQLVPPRPSSVPGHVRKSRALSETTRKQLSHRVREFRLRRLNGNLPLEFETEDQARESELSSRPLPAMAPAEAPPPVPQFSPSFPKPERPPKRASQPVEQPALEFPAVGEEAESFLALPVAPVALRLIGCAADLGLTLAGFLFFLLPLKMFAIPLPPNRFLLAGLLSAYLLLLCLYGALFVAYAGATPAMKWLGLRLVNFDGIRPSRKQRMYRLWGAIASSGSFFLGYLWAIVDEENLCWHDRISKTFLTLSDR